jgi:uracil-DNA glycosylase
MVIGNYQATSASYRLLLDGSIGGFAATWRVLRRLLASVPPRVVFLTNAFIGLPDLPKDTAPFPTTPSFTRRCERLLTMEIELFQPRCVVCLGVPAAKMLASLAPALARWRPWPGYAVLQSTGHCILTDCAVQGVDFNAVAVRHPSAVVSIVQRQEEAELVAEAAGAR